MTFLMENDKANVRMLNMRWLPALIPDSQGMFVAENIPGKLPIWLYSHSARQPNRGCVGSFQAEDTLRRDFSLLPTLRRKRAEQKGLETKA